MKTAALRVATAAFVILLGLQPTMTWASRALGTTVSGPITASPNSAQIEVAHRIYRIEANSPAAKSARSFFLGQVVDLTLTRPALNSQPEVVLISAHQSS